MDVPLQTLIGVATTVFGAGVVWGALSFKVKASQEKTAAAFKEIGDRMDLTRTDQGRRIGLLEDQIAELRGYIRGVRQRTKTKANPEAPLK